MLTLTDENYYSAEANRCFVSTSIFKDYDDCEARAFAQHDENTYEKETTEPMYIGQYAHAMLDKTVESWLERNKLKVMNKNGSKSAEMLKVENAFDRCKKDELFMYTLSGCHEEIFTFKLGGLDWKAKLDVVNRENKFYDDYKTCANFDDVYVQEWNEEYNKFVNIKKPFYIAQKYDLQLAIYDVALTQNGLAGMIPLLSCVTKEKVPDIKVLEFTGELWEERFRQLINYVEVKCIRIKNIKERIEKPIRCEKCDYCKSTKVLTEPEIARLY